MSDQIKFKYAKDGVISVGCNKTVFPAIWSIAAVEATTHVNTFNNSIEYDCPTDAEGLDILISKGMDFIENVNEANMAISMVMTAVDSSGQIKNNLSELAWLQTGLLELASKVNYSVQQMQFILDEKKPG